MLIVPVKRSGGQKCDPRTRRGVASPPTGARACTAKARRAQRARVRERPGVSLLSLPMLLRPSGQSEHGEAPRSLALVSPCQADGSPSLSLLAFSLNLFCLSAFPGDIRRHTPPTGMRISQRSQNLPQRELVRSQAVSISHFKNSTTSTSKFGRLLLSTIQSINSTSKHHFMNCRLP